MTSSSIVASSEGCVRVQPAGTRIIAVVLPDSTPSLLIRLRVDPVRQADVAYGVPRHLLDVEPLRLVAPPGLALLHRAVPSPGAETLAAARASPWGAGESDGQRSKRACRADHRAGQPTEAASVPCSPRGGTRRERPRFAGATHEGLELRDLRVGHLASFTRTQVTRLLSRKKSSRVLSPRGDARSRP